MSRPAGSTRIYVVTFGDETRLVRAVTKHQAVAHVLTGKTTVKIATQDDFVAAMKLGLQVESAEAEQSELEAA